MSHASNVLVIDDDIAVRLRIGDLLARAGPFVVHEAVDGPSGLAAAKSLRPDMILLDLNMPGMSGFEVCSALRADALTREIPVIVLSAAEESEAMIAALEAGADDFLRKPFAAPELRAKVRTIAKLDRFRALAGERDRFRWLLDHSLEPLIIADGAGALLYANDRAREVFELPEGPGADVPAAIGRHFRAEPVDAWSNWRDVGADGGESFAVFQPETPQVPARWFGVEVHALDGQANQTLLKFTNRSGTVRRELETFTFQHLISHKIRTPLNGLAPILEFLGETSGHEFSPAVADLLRLARQSAERLESTLLGVLNYHTAIFDPKNARRTDARKPLADVVATAAQDAGIAGCAVLDAPAAEVLQGELLEVALTEVLENYAKFSEARSGGIEIVLTPSDAGWQLRLFAPGAGLPPDVVAQLGRPYAQLEKTFSGEVPGMGLGLATVRILLRSAGGEIQFARHPEKAGIVTTIHLPQAFLQPLSPDAGISRLS